MKRFLSKYWQAGLTLAFALAVFLFWRFRYPSVLSYQEQLQLFLFDGDYFWERMAEPGGFARYVAEFLVQFYNSVTAGAAVIALLFMLVQRLTWRLMRSESHYALSFIPVMMLWYAMGDENVMLTYTVALALNMLMACILAKVFLAWGYERRMLLRRLFVMLVVVPLAYWLTGPMVLLLAVVLMPVSVVYALALMLLSAHYLPFPLARVMLGVGYYRVPATLPYLLMVLPAVVWIISNVVRLLPKASRVVNAVEVALAVGLLGVLADVGFDKKKYELIEYDYLVRAKDWNAIIAKAERRTPDLPMSVSATNLALGMTNQLGERAFDFYQRGAEGLLPGFERNFATTQLTGEIYFHLGLVNTAQRMAFEAMEAIPNYNKSARVMKRLAETNLINGQYEVARKYLLMLEKTIFYRPWAQRTLAMLGDENTINAHPLYGTMRQYRLQEDFLFSDRELDKICGRLFMHNQQNRMAVQYLLLMPLLDRDVPRFMSYVQLVQNKIQYNPRAAQEAIAFAFMQQRRQPPRGLVSQLVLQQMNEFARVYGSGGKDAPGLERFRNTVWYYLTVGK
jgi:hypothetical protein